MVDQPKPFGVFYQGHTVAIGPDVSAYNCSSSVVQLIVYKYSGIKFINTQRFMYRVNNSILLNLMEESGGQYT